METDIHVGDTRVEIITAVTDTVQKKVAVEDTTGIEMIPVAVEQVSVESIRKVRRSAISCTTQVI